MRRHRADCRCADLEAPCPLQAPRRSEGKVLLANGFNWQRYRVLFDNGAEVGDLDHRHLEAVGRAAKRLAKAAKR